MTQLLWQNSKWNLNRVTVIIVRRLFLSSSSTDRTPSANRPYFSPPGGQPNPFPIRSSPWLIFTSREVPSILSISDAARWNWPLFLPPKNRLACAVLDALQNTRKKTAVAESIVENGTYPNAYENSDSLFLDLLSNPLEAHIKLVAPFGDEP